jgi:multisubunit Na+/H+ antiporter MnhE subunit
MNSHAKIITATKWTGSTVLIIGILLCVYGFVSDSAAFSGIGIGTIVGAVFIFLMGMFFVTTEEMVENTIKGSNIAAIRQKNPPYLYLVKK